MGEWEDPFNIIGFVGGVVLATALLPQIYLAHSRKSTADISYLWQAVYTVGLLTLMIYYFHFRLWAVFYPMAFEFSSLMYLTGLKIYYEVCLGNVAPPEELPPLLEANRSGPSLFDDSRSGRIGRMPSKLSLDAIDDASKSGRRSRMLSKSSLRDTSSNGIVCPHGQPSVLGTTSLDLPRPPVMGRTRSRPHSPDAVSGGGTEVGGGAVPRHEQRADEAKVAQAPAVAADDSIHVLPSE
ncbi:unnamed protein product [Ectocarpus sp. 8 AP-2014]